MATEVYQIEYKRDPSGLWEPWAAVCYQEMAEQIAKRIRERDGKQARVIQVLYTARWEG